MPETPRVKRRNPALVGVYVDVPKVLYKKFRELYPTKGALRALVIATLKAATKEK